MVSYSPEAGELLPAVAGNTRAVTTAITDTDLNITAHWLATTITTLSSSEMFKSIKCSRYEGYQTELVSQLVYTSINKILEMFPPLPLFLVEFQTKEQIDL